MPTLQLWAMKASCTLIPSSWRTPLRPICRDWLNAKTTSLKTLIFYWLAARPSRTTAIAGIRLRVCTISQFVWKTGTNTGWNASQGSEMQKPYSMSWLRKPQVFERRSMSGWSFQRAAKAMFSGRERSTTNATTTTQSSGTSWVVTSKRRGRSWLSRRQIAMRICKS